MFRRYPAFLHRISPWGLLLILGLAMVATCPVKSLVFDLDTVRTGMKQQARHLEQASTAISCTIDYAVAEASLLDIHKPGVQKIAVFLSFTALLFRSVSIVEALNLPFHPGKHRKSLAVPLFLKNSSFRL